MTIKPVSIVLVFAALALAGCYESYDDRTVTCSSSDYYAASEAARSYESAKMMARAAPPVAMEANPAAGAGGVVQQRKVAESQQWVFELKSDALENAWSRHRDICLALVNQCDVVQASIASRGAGEGARSAHIEMRVEHAALDKFLAEIDSAGAAPIETNITREDKTLQWVDLQSRLENAKNLRTRLQDMVKTADYEHKLTDLLAIERELNRVQSTIDSMESQSRVLAQQTDKVRLDFRYQSAPETVIGDVWEPIRYAWHNMSNTFSRSVSEVMLFAAASLPWLIVLIPGWMLGRRLLRRLKQRWKRHH